MKRILKYFLNGLITVVPICTVLYVAFQLFEFLDSILGKWIRQELHGDYLPGFGLLLGIILVTIIGWLATAWLTRRIFEYMDAVLNHIPLVKSLYGIVKDTIQSLVGEKRSFSKVVLIKIPSSNIRVIGFVTSEQVFQLGDQFQEHMAVYLPQSFQIAGVTVIVPKSDVEILDLKVEDALKFIISAGVTDVRASNSTTEAEHIVGV